MSNEWQSIETAPKNGTMIWLYGKTDGENRMEIGFFNRVWKCFVFPDSYGYYENIEPTHWMPLPTRPQTTQKCVE